MTWLATLIVLLTTLISANIALAFPAEADAVIQAAQSEQPCLNDSTYPQAFMRAHSATVIRVAVPPIRIGQGLECIRSAAADGKLIYLTLDPGNVSPPEAAAFIQKWLPTYENAGHIWALSVQNEPELGGPGYYAPETPAQYRAIWDATEPVMHHIDPNLIGVFGQTDAGAENFIKNAWTTSPPQGVGAIVFHGYGSIGMNSMPEFSAWAKTQGKPFWVGEYTNWANPPAEFARALSYSPNVQLVNYYEWEPNPNGPGWPYQTFTAPATATATPTPVTNVRPSTSTSRVAWIPAPPKPSIVRHPPRRTKSHVATFRVADMRTHVTFEYRLDRGHWHRSSSRPVLRRLTHKRHIFYVRALDGHGISQITNYAWTVAK